MTSEVILAGAWPFAALDRPLLCRWHWAQARIEAQINRSLAILRVKDFNASFKAKVNALRFQDAGVPGDMNDE
jgi:hypothetical protein